MLGLSILYVINSYITGKRETFLMPKGYEGALIIIANQPDGIEINRSHAVYDFRKSKVIKLKGDLVIGFSPWGYLNHYEISSSGENIKIKVVDNNIEQATVNSNQIYVWDYYFEIGGCELKGYEKTNYEALIIGKVSSLDSLIGEKHRLVNEFACKARALK